MKNLAKYCIIALSAILLPFSCKNDQKEDEKSTEIAEKPIAENEKFRPAFHFTPEQNWMNDLLHQEFQLQIL